MIEILQKGQKNIFFGNTVNNKTQKKEKKIMRYMCQVCGYVYDEEEGDAEQNIPAGTKWEDLPSDWVCPLCMVGKEHFHKE